MNMIDIVSNIKVYKQVKKQQTNCHVIYTLCNHTPYNFFVDQQHYNSHVLYSLLIIKINLCLAIRHLHRTPTLYLAVI